MGAMKPLGEEHLALFRRHMVEIVDMHVELASEEIGKEALDPRVRTALLRVQRHLFVPAQLALAAYQDTPLPIGFDKTVSQPFIGALMLDLLDIAAGDRLLEIGTGLGYQAALMAEMGADVWSVEIVEEFASEATMRLRAFGYGDVQVRTGDGSRGWAEHAPFDKILVTAAAAAVPQALADQLRPGGRLVMPVGGKDVQQLSLIEKALDGTVATRAVMPVRFTQLETAA
jgi:protein-L-isoaspartate(D-aspartate) O-methyltransferase